MRKFEFRLQRVLDYRVLQEEWALTAYREAKASRIQAERELELLVQKKLEVASQIRNSLVEMKDHETWILRIEDEIEAQLNVIKILETEEKKQHDEWIEAKKALESMNKLRDLAREEYEQEANREEQKQLDEWASRKRAA